jgi:putative ABC transport system permease protein
MHSLLQDLKFSLRLFTKSPGFTTTAVLTLALAIGVNSAIFALVNGLILHPLIPSKPAEVVSVFTARKEANRDYRQFSYAEYTALSQAPEIFSAVTAVNFALAGVARDNEPMRRSFIFEVTDNFFSFMGVQPAAGRFFTPEEAKPNANVQVVVASYPLWQRMGGRPDFVGSTLRLNGKPHIVVGVAPAGFSGISALIAPELWVPLGLHSQISSAFSSADAIRDLNHPKNYTLNVMARLQPGLTLESARARLPVVADRLNVLLPSDNNGQRDLQVVPPSRFSVSTSPSDDGPLNVIGILLLGMAGVVLLIASLNLANMLLARGTTRAREMAIRLAVGATRWQVVRQLLVEGLTLAIAGGAIGLLLSFWSNSLLESSFTTLLSSMNFSLTARLEPDHVVLAVTFLFCLLATLVFSLGPALKSSRADLVHDLKAQAGEPAVVGRWNRFFAPRHILVMAQMTLSLVLLFSAGLFFRGALKAGGIELGFDPRGVLLTEMDFSLSDTPSAEGLRRMLAAADRAQSLPGVTAAGLTTLISYGNITNGSMLESTDAAPAPTGKVDPKAPERGSFGVSASITPGYLDSIGVHVLRGRNFTDNECRRKDTPAVCLLDEGMAKKLFPDKDAVGRRVRLTQPPSDGSPAEMEVVGVVNRHRHDVQDKNGAALRYYQPLAQSYNASAWLSVRYAATDPDALAAALPTLRKSLQELDPGLPVLQQLPYTTFMEKCITLWVVRLGAVMFGVFGGIALLLAIVGVYGVKAYTVERRTREIGIRMALGAGRRDVFALIMKQGALQIATAVGVGLVLSLLAGRVLATMLFEVSPADPVSLVAAVLLLAGAALLACYLPALRATRVSPTTALRSE